MPSLLPLEDYKRYGRQMILDEIGLEGQCKLKSAAVAIIGAGGLGCPAAQYLAAAGIGRLLVVDPDTIELSNLQRQILHTEARLGTYKATSAVVALQEINSTLHLEADTEPITTNNALERLRPFDVILDCTDNAPTRYLLSDSAVILKKPLVSGAAQRLDGQLCIYNLDNTGPCYRCLFPQPSQTAASCDETGILGAVTGVIGTLQALEAIKIILGKTTHPPSMLLYSALAGNAFRTVKLRSKHPKCVACTNPHFSLSDLDYVQFCGGPTPDWKVAGLASGTQDQRIYVQGLNDVMNSKIPHRILDVRPPVEYSICHLPNSINIPLTAILSSPENHSNSMDTYIVCRLGNDSQVAATALRQTSQSGAVFDVRGGLVAWSKHVDVLFPVY